MESSVIHIIITLVVVPLVMFLFQRFVNSADATRKEEEMAWRDSVTKMFDRIERKITSYCADNHKEHDELYQAKNSIDKRVSVMETVHQMNGCNDGLKRRATDQ